MNTEHVLAELRAEREKIDRAIQALEGMTQATSSGMTQATSSVLPRPRSGTRTAKWAQRILAEMQTEPSRAWAAIELMRASTGDNSLTSYSPAYYSVYTTIRRLCGSGHVTRDGDCYRLAQQTEVAS